MKTVEKATTAYVSETSRINIEKPHGNYTSDLLQQSITFDFLYVFRMINSVAPEPEGSSPHSQQPAKGPYPEPGEPTPTPPNNLPKIYFHPIFPSTPWSSNWPFSFRLSHQKNPVHVSTLYHACHMPRQPHSPSFDLPNNIW
jgi:hypothetical protein